MNNDHRLSWLAALAKLTTPHDPERAAAAMSAYLPFLTEFPDQAFTLASMRDVAMAERRMMIPDLREVLEPLQAWWKANRPYRTALPAPVLRVVERAEPTEEERAAVARTVQQAIGAMRGGNSGAKAPVRTVAEQLEALRS